ncbi:hypothetical protein [Actinotalea sp. C106]|uniref:hypothetical protein n=1 Tax=Actinotalea sp. C106 TaxID=2908644 RepID=UPI00202853FC|nr:hypothetical protein [Actinotalea sp. C106]
MTDSRDPQATPPHRPWSTVLLVLHWLAVTAFCLLVGSGVVLLAMGTEPSPPGSESADALGTALAESAIGYGAVLLALAIALAVLTSRGRRRADHGRPATLRNVAIAAAGLGAVSCVGLLALRELISPPIPLVVVALYTAVAVRTVQTVRA